MQNDEILSENSKLQKLQNHLLHSAKYHLGMGGGWPYAYDLKLKNGKRNGKV